MPIQLKYISQDVQVRQQCPSRNWHHMGVFDLFSDSPRREQVGTPRDLGQKEVGKQSFSSSRKGNCIFCCCCYDIISVFVIAIIGITILCPKMWWDVPSLKLPYWIFSKESLPCPTGDAGHGCEGPTDLGPWGSASALSWHRCCWRGPGVGGPWVDSCR